MHAKVCKYQIVFRRSKRGRHGRCPCEPSRNGGGRSSNHDSRSSAMVRLGRGGFMVAVVDGRRRWRLVYVRYRLYYSYVSLRRIYFFRLVNGGSRSRTKKKIVRLTRNPVNSLTANPLFRYGRIEHNVSRKIRKFT